jgi:alpha-D-ribose 1-methylphosphonate 5-triphosphate diphosphatase PhnM
MIVSHTDHIEAHYMPRPKVHWDPLSAVVSYDGQLAVCGITTVLAITLPAAMRTVTRTPVAAVGLDDRGEIAVGKRADLVRVRITRVDAAARDALCADTPLPPVPVVRAVWRTGARVA